ncbi:facilitated trehalose transporter Tret1-like [Anopheles aquasalis]|uniref:facilitated trehalose transporter Tret1-like n=1 Tax=Anopheles aquasalis TaxID=42839 RepID=UPI00215A1A12|nr:facilitated trehalose transporter Tret1-like [Anopheles aquasalis]
MAIVLRIGVLRQYLASILVNLLGVGYGTVSGWSSAALPLLESTDQSPLVGHGPISPEEASWIGGALCLGGIVGTFVAGLLVDRIGRKWTAWLAGFPLVAAWVLVILADHPGYLIGTRFLGGLAGGIQYVAIPLYVPELAETSNRGTLGSMLVLSCCVGVELAYLAGAFLPYHTIPWVCLTVPLFFLVTFFFMPESPHYLATVQRHQAAERSLRFYRTIRTGTAVTMSAEFEDELKRLQASGGGVGVGCKEKHQHQRTNQHPNQTPPLRWTDFNTNHARRAFLICLFFMTLNQFCGCFYMMNYAGSVFAGSEATGPTDQPAAPGLSANHSVIVVGLIQLCGCYASTLLVDRWGRKLLLVISSLGMALGQFVFAGYCYGQTLGYDLTVVRWLPLVCFSAVLLVGSLGVLPLPFVVLGEIMPLKIKGFATTFCMAFNWALAFLALKYFGSIGIVYGMHVMLCLFAVSSLIGAIFTLLVLPETKGKSFEQIQQLMER